MHVDASKSLLVLSKLNRNIRGRSQFQSFSAPNAVTFLLFHCNVFAPQRQQSHYISFPSCQMWFNFTTSKQGVTLPRLQGLSSSPSQFSSKQLIRTGAIRLSGNVRSRGGERKGEFAIFCPSLRRSFVFSPKTSVVRPRIRSYSFLLQSRLLLGIQETVRTLRTDTYSLLPSVWSLSPTSSNNFVWKERTLLWE